MRDSLKPAAAGFFFLMLTGGSWPAHAATDVNVVLQDPSTDNGSSTMSVLATPKSVKSGTVVFTVKNASKTLVHEMLLLRPPASGQMPYDAKDQRVIEDKLVKTVDTDDIQPGQIVKKTAKLAPGSYEMICNQPGHFEQGMHLSFHVTQ